ncbi:MAG: iron-containing alcohol dehydrogenase [Pseudomonadales bacterium]
MTEGFHAFSKQDALVWGKPAAQAIRDHMVAKDLRRAVILTNHSMAQTGYLLALMKELGPLVAGSFTECAAHSPRDSVLKGAAVARSCRADALIAVGGGSVIDAVKLMLGCLWLDLKSHEDVDSLRSGAHREALKADQRLRMMAVPTTLSAAEFTHLAGITDTRTATKELFEHPLYAPSLVVLDPIATQDTPAWLMASTGIRSVDHCVETICSNRPSPYADAMAQSGLELLVKGLRAVQDAPSDLNARLNCQLGTWLAISGPVAGVPIGASHVIGRVLGGAFGVPHGHTSCVLLPGVLRWNAPASETKQKRVAAAMGQPHRPAADVVAELVRGLQQPSSLRDIGIQRDHFPLIAEKSLQMFKHPGSAGNPRPIKNKEDVFEILESVY